MGGDPPLPWGRPGLTASSRLSTWLLRPYLDLGPCARGPLHVLRVEECWRAFVDPASPPFSPQRALPPAFRAQVVAEAGQPAYAVADPRELPEAGRTARWQQLCDAIDGWHDLPVSRQCRLTILMHALCLYDGLLAIAPSDGTVGPQDPHRAELAFWRAFAGYLRDLPARMSDYGGADMSRFEAIARDALEAVPAGFNAAIRMFVHAVKVGAPYDDLTRLASRAERALMSALHGTDGFDADLLSSRFHRAMAFVPQRRGDRAEVVKTMDLAERHARALTPTTTAQTALCLENLHALMESRTKEALWLGDMDRALASALGVTEVDPYDSKAWVEVGQVRMARKEWTEAAHAYVVAAMLGPPASAVGRHMAGVCLRELGQDVLAGFFFTETLEIDPLGISPRDAIHELPDTAVVRALKEWTRSTIDL